MQNYNSVLVIPPELVKEISPKQEPQYINTNTEIKNYAVVWISENSNLEKPNEFLKNALEQSEEDVKNNEVIVFKSNEDVFAYLRSEIEDEKQTKQSPS